MDSSEIKLYIRHVVFLTNAMTFQENLLPPLTDLRLDSGALRVSRCPHPEASQLSDRPCRLVLEFVHYCFPTDENSLQGIQMLSF